MLFLNTESKASEQFSFHLISQATETYNNKMKLIATSLLLGSASADVFLKRSWRTLNPDDKMSPFIRIANLLTTLNSQELHVLNQISEQQKLNDQRNHYQSLANEIAEDVNLHINEIEANGNFKMDDNCWGMIKKVSDIFREERERFYERYGDVIGEIRFGYGNMERRNKTNYIE